MTPTNVVASMPGRSCFKTPFSSKRVHDSETLPKAALQFFHPNFQLIFEKLSRKISPLVRSEISGLCGNMLTPYHMSSRHRWEKLRQELQTLLSQKRRTISQIFIAISESKKYFDDFEKKDQLHSLNISKLIDPDKCCYFKARKILF